MQQNTPIAVKVIFAANLGFYGLYKLANGPQKMWLKRTCTLQPNSNVQSLLLFHFCPTSLFTMLFTSVAFISLGRFHAMEHGIKSFYRVFGVGCAGAAIASAASIRHNESMTQAGGLGVTSALLTFHLLKNPNFFRLLAISNPTVLLSTLVFYALYTENTAMLGGAAAGYGAVLACL